MLLALRDGAPRVPVRRVARPAPAAPDQAEEGGRVVRRRRGPAAGSPEVAFHDTLRDEVRQRNKEEERQPACPGAERRLQVPGLPELPRGPRLPMLAADFSRAARQRRRRRARQRGMIAEAQLQGIMDACCPPRCWPKGPNAACLISVDSPALWAVCAAGFDAGLAACHVGAVTDSARTAPGGGPAAVKLPLLDHEYARRGVFLALRVLLPSFGIVQAFFEYVTTRGELRNIDFLLRDASGAYWFGDLVLHDEDLTPVFSAGDALAPRHDCRGRWAQERGLCGLCQKRALCRERTADLDALDVLGGDREAGFVVFHVWALADTVVEDRLPRAFLAGDGLPGDAGVLHLLS